MRSIEKESYGSGTVCPVLVKDEPCILTDVDCETSEWSDWGNCTSLCGLSSIQSRTREVIRPQIGSGQSCGSLIQVQECPVLSGSCGPGLTCYPVQTAAGVVPTCIDVPASDPTHECQRLRPCGNQVCYDAPAPDTGHICMCDTTKGYLAGIASTWGGEGCVDLNACDWFPCSQYSTGCTDLPAPYHGNSSEGRLCGRCNTGYSGNGSFCIDLSGSSNNLSKSPAIISGIVLIAALVAGIIVFVVVIVMRRRGSGELVLAGTGNPNAEAFVNPLYERPARGLALDNPRCLVFFFI